MWPPGRIDASSSINAVSFSQPAIRLRRSPRPKDRCEKFCQFVDGRVETPKRPVGLRDGCSRPARALSHNRENCMRRVASRNGYTMHFSRSDHAVIRVYDAAGKGIEAHEHAGERGDPGPTSVDVAPRLLAVSGRRLFREELPDDASLVLVLDAREQLCPQLSNCF